MYRVITYVMIGQFGGPCFTVCFPKSKVCLKWNLPSIFEPRDIKNIILALFFQSVLQVLEHWLFPLGFMAFNRAINLSGEKFVL